MPIATERIELALTALQVAGLDSRQDFHDTLAACFVARVEHRPLFDQAFDAYWVQPDLSRDLAALMQAALQANASPSADTGANAQPAPAQRRLQGVMAAQRWVAVTRPPAPPARDEQQATQTDSSLTWSEKERLQKADFNTMSAAEWQQAQALLRPLARLFEPLATRRQVRARGPGGGSRVDGRATLQAQARCGGELWPLRWRRPGVMPAPLLVLADISGSMRRYSRMLLHFTHAAMQGNPHVESFVFGTRLTHTTRALRQRDPDVAVAQVVREVQDWSGGTRITACLREFNQRWARRVAGSRSTVLLISDGLEQGHADDPACQQLRFEMERLHKSCRRLIWLNPLLRFDGFEPRAAGIRAMLPQVDQLLPVHNLQSLQQLVQVLAGPGSGSEVGPGPGWVVNRR